MNSLYSCVRRGLRLLVAGIVGVLVSAAASAVDWTIQDLGTLGGRGSQASAINNRGWVVGGSDLTDNTRIRAFLYDSTGMHNLGSLVGGTFSSSGAFAINIRGQAVGGGTISGSAFSDDGHAILFDSTGVHDLGTLGGCCSGAFGINASGQVVGFSQTSGGTHAFLYDGTGMHDLHGLLTLGGSHSIASGINASGQVVGESYLSGDIGSHAILYDGTALRDLGTLGGTYTSATGINASGQVVGYSYISDDNHTHAFFHNGTAMLDLGTLTLDGFGISRGFGINARGHVVGDSYTISGYHGFLYDGTWRDPVIVPMRDLSTLAEVTGAGWQQIEFAAGINDSGQIVGGGIIGGNFHAYRLHPQTMSRYMQTIDPSTLFNLGCRQTNQNGVVILDFGAPRYNGTEYGTTLFSRPPRFTASIAGIETSVKAFLDGYHSCAGNGMVTVAVGTSNDGRQVTAAHGLAWGEMIVRLNAYISGPLGDRLSVVGASDIELLFSPPAIARAWVDGYRSASPDIGFFNYGDAANCPPRRACLGGWTQGDIFYVSWGNPPGGDGRSFPIPEIYYNPPPSDAGPVNALQWVNIATLYSSSSPMKIPAALTQWQACIDRPSRPPCSPTNTPVQAWQQMMDGLYGVAADPTTVQNILYSSDITWQNVVP